MEKSVDLILEFGEALHSYGAASYNLEQALQNISKQLGLKGDFFAAPTLLISTFADDTDSKTYVRRVYPADVDLRKLSYLDALGDKLIEGSIDVEKAYAELKRIRNLEDPFGSSIQIFAFGLIGICASVFFNASLSEMIASSIVGLIVGIVTTQLSANTRMKNFAEFLAAFLATISAALLAKFFDTYNFNLVLIASLIVLIPGLSLTIAITELATLNLASGTARLMQSILIFFKLAFGVALGIQTLIVLNFNINFPYKEIEVVFRHKAYSIVFAAFAFCVLFKIPLRFYPWVLLAGSIGFSTTYFTSPSFGATIGTFLAGFAVCLLANAFARWRKRPALLLELPGLILIVPGSVGFKGLQFFFDNNTLAGLESIFNMFLIAVALVSGFLLANILLVPKRSL